MSQIKAVKRAVIRYISTPAEVIGDVGELLCNQHAELKMKSLKVLLAILGNIRYLVRQALPLRGNWNLETGSEENCLISMHLRIENVRGQCYNGKFTIAGGKIGVATQIKALNSKCLYTQCYGHALNLAVADAAKLLKCIKQLLRL